MVNELLSKILENFRNEKFLLKIARTSKWIFHKAMINILIYLQYSNTKLSGG